MSLILSGTDGLSDVDGSAATPAIRGTDANTGIFFPAADTIAFSEGGVEAARFDSAGNLGIGTASPDLYASRSTVSINGSTGGIITLQANGTQKLRLFTGASSSIGTLTGALDISTGDASALTFATNSAERMRLDASGNLGLGVTPSASTLAQFEGGSNFILTGRGNVYIGNNVTFNSSFKYIATAAAAQYNISGAEHRWLNAPSGTAGNAISFTQAMTLDASGNLLVGRTSGGSYKLDVVGDGQFSGTSADTRILMTATGVANTVIGFNNSGSTNFAGAPTGTAYLSCAQAYPLVFGTSATERARIDSSGNLLVGTTSSVGNSGVLQVKRTNEGACLYLETNSPSGTQNVVDIVNASNAAMGQMIRFWVNGYGVTQVGSISTTTSSTAYNTSSDYRLKNTVTPMTGALAKVALLKPVTYKWNNDGSYGEGFIAHELAEVVPDCVTGEKDAVDENGKIKPQGIDTSFLVATLTAAIQELNAKFEEYKSTHP
jgi:hypothetical protein